MSDYFIMLLALLLGTLLGVIFFGGLWFTVKKGVSAKNPAIWFTSSIILRTSIVISGFYFISKNHWERMLICLLGFIISRSIITKITRGEVNNANNS